MGSLFFQTSHDKLIDSFDISQTVICVYKSLNLEVSHYEVCFKCVQFWTESAHSEDIYFSKPWNQLGI